MQTMRIALTVLSPHRAEPPGRLRHPAASAITACPDERKAGANLASVHYTPT